VKAKRVRDNRGVMIRLGDDVELLKLAASADGLPAVTWCRAVLLKAARATMRGKSGPTDRRARTTGSTATTTASPGCEPQTIDGQ
jgi:hypothetical protein